MKYNRDKNEPEIVEALEKVGARVYRISCREKAGCPDLVVFFRGGVYVLEVKTATGDIKKEQAENVGCKFVRTAEEALRAIGAVTGQNTGHNVRVGVKK